MSHPLLERELRLRRGRRPLAGTALLWTLAWLALGLLTLAAGRLLASPAGDPRAALRAAILLRAALIALAVPALALPALATERGQGLVALYLGRWRAPTLLLAKSALPAAAAGLAIAGSGLPLWARAGTLGAPPFAALARAELVLTTFALAALALGLLCSTLIADLSAAAAVVYAAVALTLVAPVLGGPLLERLPDAQGAIQATLASSPVIAVASALDFDILRTETLYRLSPIGQRRFTYPSAESLSLLFLAFALLAYAAAAWRLAAARRGRFGLGPETPR